MRALYCLFLTSLASAPVASAHVVSMSTGELRINGTHAAYELRMPMYEVAHVAQPERTLLDQVKFASGGSAARRTSSRCAAADPTYVCTAAYEFDAAPDAVDIDCTLARVTVPNHVHLLRAAKDGKWDQAAFDLSFTHSSVRFRPPSPWLTAVRDVAAGALQAIAGAAPLLFLAALALAARERRELMLLASMLIAGECAGVAAGNTLALSPRFLEAAAALTIAYLAFEILLLPQAGQRWLVVLLLGLFHGAYFSMFLGSGAIQAVPFLAGAALMQTAALTVFGLAVRKFAKFRRVVPVLASTLLTVGLTWFFFRLKG